MYVKDWKKTAIVSGDEHISYADTIMKIKEYSLYLQNSKKTKVALFFENRSEWVFAFFAAWNTGCINVPIDMMSTKEEIIHILNDCQAETIFTSNKNIALLESALPSLNYKPIIFNVDALPPLPKEANIEEYSFTDDETALMLYTSGTTGKSKGVCLSYKNVTINVEWNNKPGRININDVMLAVLPNHHAWPLMATLLCPLDCGATVVFLKKLSSQELLKALKDNHVTMLTAVPRLFEMLHKGVMTKIRASKAASILFALAKKVNSMAFSKLVFKKVHTEFGGNIKVFISGGAPLDLFIIKDFRTLGILMLEGYGLTETAPMVTFHPFDAQVPGSVGKIFSDIEYKILDDGELILRGPNVMQGYYKNQKATDEVLTKDGWFTTGDLVRIDEKGYLFLTGRKKELIILGNGKNVRPDLIEADLKEKYNLIENVAVMEKDKKLVAVIKPNLEEAKKQGISNLVETIKWSVIDKYNQGVENYKKLHDFIIVKDDLPATRMGKIKRHLLAEFVQDKDSPKKQIVQAPSYEEYKMLSDLIVDISGKIPSPVDHLEIDVGLDSLSLVELQFSIEKTFGLKLQDGQLADFESVLALAEYIKVNKTQLNQDAVNWKEIFAVEKLDEKKRPIWMLSWLKNLFNFFISKKISLQVTGQENIPEGPCVIAPNHESFLDVLVLISELNKETMKEIYFLAKLKNFDFFIGRFFAKRAHVIVMDMNKNLIQSLSMVASYLKSGKKVVIFPEGARSRDGNLADFKKSYAVIAKELGVPVVPVALNGTFEALPIGTKWPIKSPVSVQFLKGIESTNLSAEELNTKVRDTIAKELN